MHAVDTNVLVRFLTRDDPDQSRRALAIFREHSIWIAKTVLLETEWVLRSLYGLETPRIADAFERVSGLANVQVEDSRAVRRALNWLADGVDFADALHLASSGDSSTFVTFDERLRNRATAVTEIAITVP